MGIVWVWWLLQVATYFGSKRWKVFICYTVEYNRPSMVPSPFGIIPWSSTCKRVRQMNENENTTISKTIIKVPCENVYSSALQYILPWVYQEIRNVWIKILNLFTSFEWPWKCWTPHCTNTRINYILSRHYISIMLDMTWL